MTPRSETPTASPEGVVAAQSTPPQEDMLRALAQASPIPLLISRVEGGEILYCNERLAKIVGMTPEQVIGLRTIDFYEDPADREAVLEELRQSGRLRDREVRLKTPDGNRSWAIFSIEPVEVAGEKLLLGALYDVTRRKHVEQRLQESESRFRAYVENASDLVFACDRQLRVTYASPNSTRILGRDARWVVGRRLSELVHKNDVPALWACAERTKETGSPQPAVEFRTRHRDGSTRWFVSALSPLFGSGGTVVGLTGTAHDITKEKQAIERLESLNQNLRDAQLQLLESEKMASLGMLMAGIAHEIRTPIAAVSSTQKTIEKAGAKLIDHLKAKHPEVLKDAKVARLFEVLVDSTRVVGDGSERVLGIVQRLRKFSCGDETTLTKVDLNAIAEDTLALLHHELKHHVVVHKKFGRDVTVIGSPSRLNQVFVNLLVNAGHAIRARGKGHITLTTRPARGGVEIEVHDDGIGIAPEDLERVFSSGFTTKKAEGGSGLGLAISKEIVEAHHGQISVESQQGVGTTFRVRLPRTPPRADCSNSECSAKPEHEGR